MNKYFETLELHKILEMLSNEASNEGTKRIIKDLSPIKDINIVRTEIEKTSEALEKSIKFGSPSFYNFKDVSGSINRAQVGGKLSLREILDIGHMLYQIRQLSSWYAECDEITTELDYLFRSLSPNKYLEDKIKNTIIDEDEIADTASPELASIRRKIVQASARIRDSLDKMIKSSSTQKYLQESIVTIRDGRYVVPVKSEYKNEISGLIHDTSGSGSTLFIEPISVVEANNEIKVLQGREVDEIDRIISELCAELAAFGDSIIQSFKFCVELNLYFAKSNLAIKMNAVAPEIVDDGQIFLRKARHPLIDKKQVVPVDISLGTNFDVLVITGPNTGGKTVILKTVGLLTAMTMCGLLIPVSDGSKISVFDKILVDIGDQQSIEQSLSTFSSHMNKVIEILESADNSSLVLLDELGSGTDPIEGAALAVSIIENLKSKGAKLITTTHYQELKMFALDTPNVENASCEFDIKTLKPTYRLIIGSPGKSNAFAISSKLGLADDIIDYAKNIVGAENKRFDDIMEKLEANRIETEKFKNETEALKRQTQELKIKLENEKEELIKQKEIEIQKAREEASRIVRKVTIDSQKLIDELDEIRKAKDSENFSKLVAEGKAKSKTSLDKLYLDSNPVSEQNNSYKLPRPLIKGDSVLISDTNKKGIVVTEPDSSGNLFIQVGIMKTKINVSKLRLIEKEKVTYNNNKISTKNVESRATRQVKLELDIRGYACDEGLPEVDTFLDNAVMSGMHLVTIIHGKGTGVLKIAVRQHLKSHPLVKSYRKGVYGEGEDGVTVVELK